MENVVAVAVRLADGSVRYFVTWGRIQDTVDPQPLEALVLRHSPTFDLGGEAVAAQLCHSLREPAESAPAPYLYDCLVGFCAHAIPFGRRYERWRAQKARLMDAGRELAYCGNPNRYPSG